MAELLVFRHDRVNASDFYKNLKLYKSGDVVVVMPDGFAWGKEELGSKDFRIVSIPAMTVSEATQYLAPELDVDPNAPSRTLKRRAFMLRLKDVNLPQGFKNWWNDDARSIPIVKPSDFGITKTQFNALKEEKLPTVDPLAPIGESEGIIG